MTKQYHGIEAFEKFADALRRHFRITIPNRPFSDAPVRLTDRNLPPEPGYRLPLSNNELLLLTAALPDLSLRRLDAVLRRVYQLTGDELRALTWDEIGVYLQDYLESQNTPPTRPAKKIKEPPDEARIAYQLYYASGIGTQSRIAELMSDERGRVIKQHQISRWISAYKTWLEQQGLPVESTAPRVGRIISNSNAFSAGSRTDGRRPPR